MFNFRSDTRFNENPTTEKGQYIIKIEQKVEEKHENQIFKRWKTIGYITKTFDKDENKYICVAADSTGTNPLFQNIKDLHVLKQAFRNNGKQLAEFAQMAQVAKINKAIKSKKPEQKQESQRKQDLRTLRDKKGEKLKQQGITKQEQKARNLKTEKEMDAKNTEHSKTDNPPKETSQQEVKPDIENQDEQDKVSERMDELEDIREQDNGIEQDLEMDM